MIFLIEKTGYRIASFNIRTFSRQSVQTTAKKGSPKDLETIGRIIRENEIDIIAIQEITHQMALKELLERISLQYAKEERVFGAEEQVGLARMSPLTREVYGYSTKHWEGRWAKPASPYSDKSAEGYAFIWNKDRIKLVTNYEGKSFEPRIGYNLRNGKLVRPPFIGRFMPLKGRCEFRLINAHIMWEEPVMAKGQQNIGVGVIDHDRIRRVDELKTLFDTVYIGLDKKQYDVNREDCNARPLSAYTFLLGDYNLNLPQRGKGAKMPERFARYKRPDLTIYGKQCVEIVTVNEKLTTLKLYFDEEKAEQSLSEMGEERYLANNYDHFSYDTSKFAYLGIANPIVDVIFAFDYYKAEGVAKKYEFYKEKISDHLPIVLDIDIRKCRN